MLGSRGRLLGSSAMLTPKTSHMALTSRCLQVRNLGANPYRMRGSLYLPVHEAVYKQVDKPVFLCTSRWMQCVQLWVLTLAKFKGAGQRRFLYTQGCGSKQFCEYHIVRSGYFFNLHQHAINSLHHS
ncbi:hypothetical protein FGO68_gene5872 [Halteria grandinella]|uniref:Uncharacterized protein n=1 Tax=Halteria grandinella TaxID=5974 RepID=A0A8J8N9L3_HALGN|nr:hypothetical protein FGO68_gene5872 [Halteria grandinella]